MKCKILLYVCVFVVLQAFLSPALAQDIQVSGKVTSRSTGEALVGATVGLKGSSAVTVTDAEGNFRIMVPDRNATLVISYVGMTSREIPVPATGSVTVQLETGVRGNLAEAASFNTSMDSISDWFR